MPPGDCVTWFSDDCIEVRVHSAMAGPIEAESCVIFGAEDVPESASAPFVAYPGDPSGFELADVVSVDIGIEDLSLVQQRVDRRGEFRPRQAPPGPSRRPPVAARSLQLRVRA